jgi:hypothetical protein
MEWFTILENFIQYPRCKTLIVGQPDAGTFPSRANCFGKSYFYAPHPTWRKNALSLSAGHFHAWQRTVSNDMHYFAGWRYASSLTEPSRRIISLALVLSIGNPSHQLNLREQFTSALKAPPTGVWRLRAAAPLKSCQSHPSNRAQTLTRLHADGCAFFPLRKFSLLRNMRA